MAKGQRNPVLERQCRERVASWKSSGLTVREFCLRHGLRETAFHFWKRELQARDEAPAVSPKPTFVPVTILPNAEPEAPSPSPTEPAEPPTIEAEVNAAIAPTGILPIEADPNAAKAPAGSTAKKSARSRHPPTTK